VARPAAEEFTVQARDVMTREVVTVGPDTSAKYAAELMADRGFAALPVVDDEQRLVGIVAEADVLRGRLPADPRLHLRRGDDVADDPPPLLVREVMTAGVRSVEAAADVADLARLFVDEKLRSVPVLEHGRLAGIASRRDLLGVLVRPDDAIRQDLLSLVEGYTGETGSWQVDVTEGVATIRRTRGAPDPTAESERRTLRALAHTVPGVVAARVPAEAGVPPPADADASA
jgi:CBS domain-containing protein